MAVLVAARVAERRQQLVLAHLHRRALGWVFVVVAEDVQQAVDQEMGNLAPNGPVRRRAPGLRRPAGRR